MRVQRSRAVSLISNGNFSLSWSTFKHLVGYNEPCGCPMYMGFSAVGESREKLRSKGLPRTVLQGMLERALKEHRVDEAWDTYKDFKGIHGYPDQCVMTNLITEMSYSADSKYLRRACDLVVLVSKEKSVVFGSDMMTKLVLSLARAQIPISASCILRLMLAKKCLPPLDVLRLIFLHLVKTDFGTSIASNVLTEICDCFQMLNVKKSSQTDLTTIFNLVLDGCVRFGSPLKGQRVMELMPRLGVLGDAYTVLILSRIHEMNGMRDELKKFKDHINTVPVTMLGHYQQVYECLLSLHFKFNDVDSASALLLEMCGLCGPNQTGHREQEKPFTVSVGSDNIKMGLKLQFLPPHTLLDKDFVYKVESKYDLVLFKNGNFVLSNKGLAKLILAYKRNRRINELSKLVTSIQNMLSSSCSDVIDACISLGWLETAHDILEDLESTKYYVKEDSYASLVAAYYDKNMFKEAQGLVKHVRSINSKYDHKVALHLKQLISVCESYVAKSIRLEDNKVISALSSLEYDSSVYFFSKAKMVEDARKTYSKMQVTKLPPTSSTFFHLICGYSSLGMYREITFIWGDIKRSMENQNTIYHRDLYELVILNFIRGGYFERVMEVIGFMMGHHMYLDKWCYRIEFMKFHRDLYRKLTSSEAKDEVQRKRIEHVQAFRKWAGIV